MTRYSLAMAAALVMVLSAACGARIVRGEAPLVRLAELGYTDDAIAVQLNIRNLNGVPLDVTHIEFTLSSGDTELAAYSGTVKTNITANGTESLSVKVNQSDVARRMLDSLEDEEVSSIRYVMEGWVRDAEGHQLRFEHEDHLFPSPGRPGYFR